MILRSSPPDQPPVAAFSSSCSGLTCSFTSTSSDPDGSITAYSWTFGDGGTSTVQNPSHTYTAGGTYTVALTVTDNAGLDQQSTHLKSGQVPDQHAVVGLKKKCSVLTCSFTSTRSDADVTIA